ncbi:MAG: 50S ribosomal protein L1 [Candidatus Nanosyncoccaceae bacterium]|jgi:large subunit ribosomal protein L1
MAMKKGELLELAKSMKLDVTEKNTVVEINAAIKAAKEAAKQADKDVIARREAVVAKSGKRSGKALKEAEEKAAKEARKEAGDTSAQGDAEAHVKKGPAPKIRPRLERRGKSYREKAKLIDKTKTYTLAEAVDLAVQTNPSKTNATVEIHVRLGVDPRQADQNIRSTVKLPHGSGKDIRIAVFAPEDRLTEAKNAGADIAAADEFLKQLDKGELNFDVLITMPQLMPKLGKYARTLGPKGLMPNPKSGTVTTNIAKSVSEAKAGRVEYRVDKQSIVHVGFGKVSFGKDKLLENAEAFLTDLNAQKPSSIKGVYIKSIFVSTSHGPSIKVQA